MHNAQNPIGGVGTGTSYPPKCLTVKKPLAPIPKSQGEGQKSMSYTTETAPEAVFSMHNAQNPIVGVGTGTSYPPKFLTAK